MRPTGSAVEGMELEFQKLKRQAWCSQLLQAASSVHQLALKWRHARIALIHRHSPIRPYLAWP